MELITQSARIQDYLEESDVVDYSHPSIVAAAEQLGSIAKDELSYAQAAFEFVRDQVSHSWDIQGTRVTCKASDVLSYREGICYAKSNLLCALLRYHGIPTGFCYQRITLGDTPDSGYVVHALNAVYLRDAGRWIRLDARGNKPGVDARFSLDEERLAFPIREHYEEIDDPTIYAVPNPKTIETLLRHTNAVEMYRSGLPDTI